MTKRTIIPKRIIKERFKDVSIVQPLNFETEQEVQSLSEWKVFTDGSTQLQTRKCGWGAIIATNNTPLKISNCVAMGGAVGVVDNYTAELMAILAICEIAPPEKRIKIYTDSTSSIDAIQSFSHLTTRKQNRQASRPTLKSITAYTEKNCVFSLNM